ncbi:MAG: hypothetical protein CMH46_07455 [Muricauda sp.]|nr:MULTISPECIES: hypothetical protein [unclassified Allomuricauda]MAU15360.1 hypothetical protein [Allomuricauda sp.]|tara:strand:+ start:615 stop:1214 length:600 start_codon:yes stop_codon:yes gene_type:complete
MKNTVIVIMALVSFIACKKETRDQLKKAKQEVSNATKIISNAKEIQEESAKLKEVTPLTNEELKTWLPEKVADLSRTGFKVGKTGYMNVASIEGTYKAEDGRELRVEIMDGAGEIGSALMVGMGAANKMEVEEEDERKHLQTITKNGVKAKQTYYKKRDDTELQFIYSGRFMVIVRAKDTKPEKTWELVEKLNLESLTK